MANSNSADIVVVGSGVAGGLVAHQMALAGASVILLEAVPLITMQAQDIDSIMIAGEGSRVSLHKKGEQWEKSCVEAYT